MAVCAVGMTGGGRHEAAVAQSAYKDYRATALRCILSGRFTTGIDFQSKAGVWEEALDTVEKDIMDARPLIEKWIREDSPLYRDHDAGVC